MPICLRDAGAVIVTTERSRFRARSFIDPFSEGIHPTRAANPPWLDGPHFEELKPLRFPGSTTEFPPWITAFHVLSSGEFRPLTGFIHNRRTGRASAVDDSTPGDPNLQGHAAPAVVLPKGDSHPAARPVTSPVMDAL